LCRDALDAFDVEFAAARNIQRIFRGFRVRLVLHELMCVMRLGLSVLAATAGYRRATLMRRAATITPACRYYATELQRVYRGHLGRRRARAAVELRAVARATAAAAHLALQMQRLYRGFRSRKYVHNYYARKRFIAALTRKHEELRSQLEEQAARQEQALAAAVSLRSVRCRLAGPRRLRQARTTRRRRTRTMMTTSSQLFCVSLTKCVGANNGGHHRCCVCEMQRNSAMR